MYRDSLAMEHYRLHVIERWPDGPVKHAGLAAVRSTLESLETIAPTSASLFECATCISDRRTAKLVHFPNRPAALPTSKAA
jgi:hypothetical protein